MAGSSIEPMPVASEVVDRTSLRMTGPWQYWLGLAMVPRVQQSAPVTVSASTLAQSAAIGTTALIGAASAGLYRVTIYAQIRTAGSVSSTLGPFSLSGTYHGQTITQTIAASTANTLTTQISGTLIQRLDAASTLTYTMGYAANGANSMAFDLFVSVEAL